MYKACPIPAPIPAQSSAPTPRTTPGHPTPGHRTKDGRRKEGEEEEGRRAKLTNLMIGGHGHGPWSMEVAGPTLAPAR
eukprot:scaffold308428_cov37-Tisochrysis_lutea.AAC.1